MDLRPRAELAIRIVDDEVVILDREAGKIHQLNATASLVWNALVGDGELGSLARELARRFDVEEGAALRDVSRIVEELRDLGLLVAERTEEVIR